MRPQTRFLTAISGRQQVSPTSLNSFRLGASGIGRQRTRPALGQIDDPRRIAPRRIEPPGARHSGEEIARGLGREATRELEVRPLLEQFAAQARESGAFQFKGPAGNPLPFVEVEAQGRAERWVGADGALPALMIQHDLVPRSTTAIRRFFAERCAEQIVGWLNDPDNGFERPDQPLQGLRPRDIAILVRTGKEAAAVRRADQPFTQSEWDSIKNQALRQLTGQRFPGGRIGNSLADIDAANQRANLYIELESGPLQRIGGIEVVGSERYDPGISERLARLSGLTPGAEYDLERLQAAQQRMAASGYFDAVFVYVEPTEQAAMLPVKVQLREARRQKLVLGVGASTDSGARLSVEHLHNRVPGIGWRARSELRLDQKDQTARTDWRSPVDDKGWQWLTEAQLSRLDDSLTRTSSQRLRWGQGQDGETLDRSVYLQYDRARVVQYLPQLLPEAAESSITANYAWSRRRFDDLVSPRRGHGLAVELGAGTTLGTDRQPFARTQARWLGLWPLDRAEAAPGSAAPSNLGRLALRLEGGAVIARDNAPVPETQLFLTGGDNSVRGYGLRDIGVPSANGGVRAGRYKAVVSVEWQRPIWAENGQRSPWENVLFVDGGAVADRAGDLRPKWGVGTGLRYNSPVGPLQVDLAYGLETRELRLHLNVGFSF